MKELVIMIAILCGVIVWMAIVIKRKNREIKDQEKEIVKLIGDIDYFVNKYPADSVGLRLEGNTLILTEYRK